MAKHCRSNARSTRAPGRNALAVLCLAVLVASLFAITATTHQVEAAARQDVCNTIDTTSTPLPDQGYGPTCDFDGDGIANNVDTDPADPCMSPAEAGWTALDDNDCDGDWVRAADDLDDFNGCIDAAGPLDSCADSDGDGYHDDTDLAPLDQCIPDITGGDCDIDGDGVVNSLDDNPREPCLAPAGIGWKVQATNDCDGDGVVAADDLDDQNICVDAIATRSTCEDVDGDHVLDADDPAPNNPCVPADDPAWMAQNGNDCDRDRTMVGDGDRDDTDPCVDAAMPAPGTNDCDLDGVTAAVDLDDTDGCVSIAGALQDCLDGDADGFADEVDPDPNDPCDPRSAGLGCDADVDGVVNAIDVYPTDPCRPSTAAGWAARGTNDCDGDGTRAASDLDDQNPCVDARGTILRCLDEKAIATEVVAGCSVAASNDVCPDADGDGVLDPADADPADACVPRSQVGWTSQGDNDCDADGVTLSGGDRDDQDGCVDANGFVASCRDSDGDGVSDDLDADPRDPCADPGQESWNSQLTNDCDGDGISLAVDADDSDACTPSATGPSCDSDGDALVNSVDPGPDDPCVSPSAPGWTVQATSDCDRDGVLAGVDRNDFDGCIGEGGSILGCADIDRDGVVDSLDPSSNDACLPASDPAWIAQNRNDCDRDGRTVGAGDRDDFDSCTNPGTPAPATNDCDGDGAAADVDLDDNDGCVGATGTVATCADRDQDGTAETLDTDDRDPCVPNRAADRCDADGDGVENEFDIAPLDPCATPAAPGWVPQPANDCDNDGVVAESDLDDANACIDASGGVAECADSDDDGITDDLDPDANDPCVPDDAGPLCDPDRDGVPNDLDLAAHDPCAPSDHEKWQSLPTNDCDGDGSTVAQNDRDDFDGCIDAVGTIPECLDIDDDGVTDDVDPAPQDPCNPADSRPECDIDGDGVRNDADVEPTDPCVSALAPGWKAQPGNDCDTDGVSVADGDGDDLDDCVDASGTRAACTDSDGDGVTDSIDIDPDDACIDANQPGWRSQASNDCDGDGISLGDGDRDDRDVCVDVAGARAGCVDSDGDGVTDDRDEQPQDPCFTRTQEGWTQQLSNDCDRDTTTVADGDLDDFDRCANDLSTDTCTDTDGDGVGDYADSAPADPCADPTDPAWVPQLPNDCDRDGFTVLDGDTDDFDECRDDQGVAPACLDTDGDGLDDNTDPDPYNTCHDVADHGWAAAQSSDCDEDGVSVADGDLDDLDPCLDDAGDACFEIDGRVWFDADRSATQDQAEVDISGVRLVLIEAATGKAIDQAFTASPYTFTDVRPGSYLVRVDASTLPPGVGATAEEDGGNDQTIPVYVLQDDVASQDFGYATAQVCGVLAQRSWISPDSPITLTDEAGNLFTTTTDSQGRYCIAGTLDNPIMPGLATIIGMVNGTEVIESFEVLPGKRVTVDLRREGDPEQATRVNQPDEVLGVSITASQSTVEPGLSTMRTVGFVLAALAVGIAAVAVLQVRRHPEAEWAQD